MSKELVISANRHETKVAILEEDQLVEIYFQRANEYSLAGSIHKGRVTRVLPGMQSAFVDLGLERDTFLYVSDFFEENGEDFDSVLPGREDRPARDERPVRDDRPVREDNRGRHDGRQDRHQRPDRVATEAVADRVPVDVDAGITIHDAPPEVREISQSAAAGSAPAGRPDDRGEQGDDRNRRSRRRRNRGRGFPDSKYASESGEPTKTADLEPTDVPEAVTPVSLESDADFPVLPGESLAKYRGPVGHREPAAPPEPPHDSTLQILAEATGRYKRGGGQRHEPSYSSGPMGESGPIPGESMAKYRAQASPVAEASPIVAEAVEPVLEASLLPTESIAKYRNPPPVAEPVLEASLLPTESIAKYRNPPPVAEAVHHMAPAPEPEPETLPMPDPDPAPSADREPEAPHPAALDYAYASGAAPALEPTAFETEELEALAIVTEDDVAELDGEAEADPDEEAEPAAPSVEGAETPQTGAPREQGGRYGQRGPRRMRRKQRGGGQGQGQGGPQVNRAPLPAAAPEGEADVVPAPLVARAEPRERAQRPDRERPPLPSISELLKEGQEIIVQIAKEPLGQKGARITSHIAMPGRYVVYMPTLEHMGVSRKIASDEERLRLKKILQTHRVGVAGGYIVRTAGEGQSEEEIAADMAFLANLWLDIRQKAERKPAPLLLHHDLDVVQRILRDQVSDNFKSIWVDNEEFYESILSFVQRFQPALVSRVKLYTRSAPIFDAFSITGELEKALRPKVWLKSGGYIVINQTEALVAVDVNTGKYVGKSNRLEDTIVKTNTEAVKEIVRQIRLRDLGGIIVVDFIDMDERKNRQKVMQTLEEAMRADKAPYKILQFNDFGLVAITRKRVKQSLERALCSPCPYCEGAGYVKSVSTTVSEILQEAYKISKAVDGKDVLLRVHPEVAKFLKSNDNKYLEEMEEVLRRPVLVKGDPTLHQDKFDLA